MTARTARLEKTPRRQAALAHAQGTSGEMETIRALLKAIPQPACVARWAPTGTEVVVSNELFDQFLSQRQQDPNFDEIKAGERWMSAVAAIARGDKERYTFEGDYASALGPGAYRGIFGPITLPGSGERLVFYTIADRSDERRIENVLRRELLTDTLTALPNRTGFLEEVEKRDFDEREGHAIIAVDLVRFSRINESLGSIAGDEIIITVARRIKSILRAGDLLGRVGGNEFAIHSGSVMSIQDARNIAARVRKTLETPIRISSHLINVEAAVGCALSTDHAEDSEELFRRAQAAVKRSKSSGAFEVYRANSLTEAQARFTLESRLREAIHNDRLHLEFQPFVALNSGEVVGFEALARWHDEELGIVPPSEFIPVAEESSLIVPLGRWALRQSAQTLAQWDGRFGAQVPLTLNVNLSPVQIARDTVPDAVEEALASAGVDGKRLTIELTESALIADLEKTRQLLGALKAMDLTIAMDDFGTGFSNLANLQTLPIDVLKIDRSFVNGMVGDRDKVAIVRAILSLAGALGMRTVAEGIETAEVGQALAELGCDRGQGYYYARPMPADDAYAFWLKGRSARS